MDWGGKESYGVEHRSEQLRCGQTVYWILVSGKTKQNPNATSRISNTSITQAAYTAYQRYGEACLGEIAARSDENGKANPGSDGVEGEFEVARGLPRKQNNARKGATFSKDQRQGRLICPSGCTSPPLPGRWIQFAEIVVPSTESHQHDTEDFPARGS